MTKNYIGAGFLLHIPHSSTSIPAAVRADILLDDAELTAELAKMTDWHTHELFDLKDMHIPAIVFPWSRLCVDVERFADDAIEPMAARGMGAVYERTSDGRLLRNRMDSEARNMYLERYYNPHHKKLQELVDDALARHQRCLIVDCHSFGMPLLCDLDQSLNRPDICIGTSAHTPAALVHTIERTCRVLGLSSEVNRPFAGSLVPLKYCQTADMRVESVMIEVRREIYVDGAGLKLGSFESVREKIRHILLALRPQSE